MQSVYDHKITDEHNQPIPWFNYPSIEFIRQFDLKSKTVFEWGSGNSSLFFADRCKSILSIESDAQWYNFVKTNLRPNQTVKLITDSNQYAAAMTQPYDIVIIDGNIRRECINRSMDLLRKAELIILDNANWYAESCGKLREIPEFMQIDFFGMAPLIEYATTTTLFIKRDLKLVPTENIQPKKPIGGNWIFSHDN